MAVALLALVSCGGGSSDPSAAARAKWNDYCAFRAACGSAPCNPFACTTAYAENGPLIEFVDCQTAKACGENDDACTAAAGTTDAERQDFTTRCEAAVNANPTSPTCYIEPVLCRIIAYPLYKKQFMRAVDACLPLACEERLACIDAALQQLACN